MLPLVGTRLLLRNLGMNLTAGWARVQSIIKAVSAKWLTSAFDYIRSHPNIIINGFVKAGILDSSSGQAESSSSHVASTVVESDPFASDSDN